MSLVLEILSLQAIDDEAASFRAGLADIERRLLGDDELIAARHALVEVEGRLESVRREQRRGEAEIEDLSDRISREEKRLYDGSIKNPKELASLEHEVETQKGMRGRMEDAFILVLDSAEATGREYQAAAKTVNQLEARWHRDQDTLRHEAHRLGDAITRTDIQREAQRTKLTPKALHTYEDLRRRKGGMAVARVVGASCMGCRIQIPDGLRRKALAPSDFAQCPNCERILVLGG